MELTYTCEKGEKETLELAMRPFRRYFRTMFIVAAVMFVVSAGFALSDMMAEGLLAQSGMSRGDFFLFMSLAIAAATWLHRRRFRRGIIDTCRKRKTNLVEYRLSDEGFSCVRGESKATMPWSEFAKYCVDTNALYLQCHNGHVICIPDWSGRGVDGAELAATLEKAGLERMGASKARRFAFGALWVVLLAFIVFGPVVNIHRSWRGLRWHIVGIELKRQLHELVSGDGSKGGNPYSYSRYWKVRGNSVQRLAVLRCKFNIGEHYYIFDDDSEHDKVGLAATEGDSVWCVYLPCGCIYQYDFGEFETIKASGAFGKFYPESERDKWLEKVRPLAHELRENMDDE